MGAIISAGVAELVDARDLKSLEALLRAGSSPAPGTTSSLPLALVLRAWISVSSSFAGDHGALGISLHW